MSKQIGGAGVPITTVFDDYEARELLKELGQYCYVKHKAKAARCSCWQAKSEWYDPYCTLCSGEGWTLVERRIRILFTTDEPTRSGNGSFIITKAGIVEGKRAFAVIERVHGDIVDINDIVLYPYGTAIDPTTYIVEDVRPAYGTRSKIMFLMLVLRKDTKVNVVRY